jgi:hypothetical protein
MTNPSVNKNQRKISLISGSAAHFFHDGIADDGLAIFLPLWQASFGLSLSQVEYLSNSIGFNRKDRAKLPARRA